VTLQVDRSEPPEIPRLMQPVVPVEYPVNLNDEGYADYLWQTRFGSNVPMQQFERKTWSDLLSDLDSIEDQLRRQMQAHPDVRHGLLVEGVALPVFGGVNVYHKTGKGYMVPGKTFNRSLDAIYAWLYEVGKYMEVYFSPSLEVTATMLARFYLADQKDEHTTFRRHLKIANWHPNEQVRRLMGVCHGVKIGEAKAEALIGRFGTVYNVIKATPEQLTVVEGIGMKLARDLLRAVGRPDV
jgi:ERCC4-type nuclease